MLHSIENFEDMRKYRFKSKVSPLCFRFINFLNSLLVGSSDNAQFEGDRRAIFGAQSYLLFKLIKLISKLVKQVKCIKP